MYPVSHLEAIVESSDDAIIGKDLDGIVTSWNHGAERLYGYTAGEIIGTPLLVIIPPELHDEEQEILKRVKLGQTVRHYESVRLAKDGRVLDVSVTASPIRDASGAIIGISKVARDITERKAAQEALRRSEERYRDLVVNLDAGVVAHAPDTSVLMSNARALELLGISEDQMMGRKAMDPEWKFLHEDQTPFLLHEYPVNRVIAEKSPIKDLILGVVRPGGGDVVWLSVNGVPILDADGVLKEVIISFVDITERKLLLERFREASVRAEKASAAKSEFLGVMSHELRTPLNGILGFTDLLLDEKNLSSELIADRLRIIRSSGESLLAILGDILHFSRIDGAEIKVDAICFSPSEYAWKAIHIIEPEADAKSLRLSVVIGEDVPGAVIGDPERIQQILLNLLRNAVKFTETGGITLRLNAVGNDRIRFSVEDTGPGIASDQIQRIFLPFTQLDNGMGRKFDGVGLGLAISTRIVRALGTKIEVESDLGKGSCFSFELLLPRTSSVTVDAATGEGSWKLDIGFASHFPVRILAVEDNPINRKLLLMVLGNLGYEGVLTASNGLETLAILEKNRVDVIFMDLQMPEMDGMEAARRIRLRESDERRGQAVHIIALTANESASVRRECFDVGMNHYVSKPFNTRTLADAIALCPALANRAS